jgi:hypothetical protein
MVILYTVYGSIYTTKSENVDATTQATSAQHPQIIANHIVQSFKKK